MKTLRNLFIAATLCAVLAAPALIAEEETAKKSAEAKVNKYFGQLSCAMCALKKTDSCQAALTVSRTKADGKSTELTLLLLNNQTAKDFHKNICSGDQVSVTVKGYVSGKTGKKALVASEITKSAK